MVHALWDSLTRHRVRKFGAANAVSLITSVVICIIQTINVMSDGRPVSVPRHGIVCGCHRHQRCGRRASLST
jgi:hypothetical protein